MQPLASDHHRRFHRLTFALVAVALAAPLTYVEVARPSWDQLSRRASSVLQTLHLQNQPASQPAGKREAAQPQAAATPAAQPSPAKTATTTALTHFRQGKGVTTPIITDLPPGTAVTLRSDADATWQGVSYQGKDGYIYRAYLQY